MSDTLKQLGIAFQDPDLIERYYNSLKGIFLVGMKEVDQSGLYLDLNAIPTQPIDLKMIFIKWMIEINLPRIQQGDEPLMTLRIALMCPIWKVVRPPIKKIELTKESMFNKPRSGIGKKKAPGRINKK